jgi:hypothetical protein
VILFPSQSAQLDVYVTLKGPNVNVTLGQPKFHFTGGSNRTGFPLSGWKENETISSCLSMNHPNLKRRYQVAQTFTVKSDAEGQVSFSEIIEDRRTCPDDKNQPCKQSCKKAE